MAHSTTHDLATLTFVQPLLLNFTDESFDAISNFSVCRHTLAKVVLARDLSVTLLEALLVVSLFFD